MPQEAHLGCRLQQPHGRFAGTLARRRLTKRSRETPKGEVRRIFIPRTRVNKVNPQAFSATLFPREEVGCCRKRS